ncbi:MAG: diacylglycerol kinase family lipid kinase [Candidatus Omnitrophica bacterium]|nr:diacylglycerol kinase family lipid kinase [Candidatus Omnitrophota bacterium]
MTIIPIKKVKKIHIIINPAAGRIEPILPIINLAMNEAKIDWDVFVTKKKHDPFLFAQEAVKRNVDAVAVYGGDGTVMEAMSALLGSEIPLAILPGGTANVLATELKVPKDLKEACGLICHQNPQAKIIDVGKMNKQYFILRLGLGFEAEMMKQADRKIKNRFGRLAYVISSAKALKKIQEVQYELIIDGKKYTEKGVTCIVANSGNIGYSDLSLHNQIDVSDGLLDVVIVRRAHIGLLAYVIKHVFAKQPADHMELVQHWQGKDIQVSASPEQVVQCDGEPLEKIPVHAQVVPGAVRILVPAEKPE